MNKLVDKALNWGALSVYAILAITFGPFLSLGAIPFYAIRAIPKWIAHRSLYKKTLTNQSREKFGRIKGQDYTRWDGKAVIQAKKIPTHIERMHEALGEYFHGAEDDSFEAASDSPFKTLEDVEWLKLELERLGKKYSLNYDLGKLRAFSKALIPIIGVIWVVFSETRPGGGSEFGCRYCGLDHNWLAVHWSFEAAIDFHIRSIQQRHDQSSHSIHYP